MNEIIILLTIYHFFCFTDFVTDVETRAFVVGYSMLMMTGLNMAVNFTPILYQTIKVLKQKTIRLYAKSRRCLTAIRNHDKREARAVKEMHF